MIVENVIWKLKEIENDIVSQIGFEIQCISSRLMLFKIFQTEGKETLKQGRNIEGLI